MTGIEIRPIIDNFAVEESGGPDKNRLSSAFDNNIA